MELPFEAASQSPALMKKVEHVLHRMCLLYLTVRLSILKLLSKNVRLGSCFKVIVPPAGVSSGLSVGRLGRWRMIPSAYLTRESRLRSSPS